MLISGKSAGAAILGQASIDVVPLLLWGGILLVLMLAMGLLIVVAKKKYQQSRGRSTGGEAFDIHAVEALHHSGKITREEFSVLRNRALGLDKNPVRKQDSSSSPPAGGDDES